ncbi:MAG: sigma 54-interacting transcriptional regulator [bacterium]
MSAAPSDDGSSAERLTALYPLILDSIDQGVFTVDADFVVTSFNAAAERIIGMSRKEAIGRKCHHVFRASICESSCALRRTLETGLALQDVRVDVLDTDMQAVPICVSTAVLRDREGGLLGGVEIFRDVSELESLRRQLTGAHGFADIIGDSAPMREIFRLLPDVAAADASVLIEGPSGSGKELVARALHNLSPRADRPFVRINCGALPDTLLESELFGYVKGAFTDARRDKPGRFAQADGGTILLDEIGDVSAAFQLRLLRVLQEGELEPLGATHTVKVDVRVVSATNRDLKQRVEEGAFREDLYYRLRVVPIQLPALRDRLEDIPLLVDHFVGMLTASTGKPIRGLTRDALQLLGTYSYPGNVRELRNILERAFVICHGELIDVDHLPQEVLSGVPVERRAPHRLKPSERRILAGERAPHSPSSSPEVTRLVEALDEHDWNRTRTARSLGIARNTLWRRMRDYGLLE